MRVLSLECYVDSKSIGTRHRVTASVKTCNENLTTSFGITVLVVSRDSSQIGNRERNTCALEEKLLLQERLLQEKRSGELQNQLITALGSDYWSVYLVHLDKDEGICYQESGEEKDFKIGQRFPYMESIQAYARDSVTDEYRDDFLKFTNPDAIREGLRKFSCGVV